MTDWQFLIVLFSAGLLFFLLWKEGKRRDKRLLVWRLLTTIIAVTSLVFLAIPLHYKKTIKDASTHEAILLTEGYSADSLTHFLTKKSEHIPVFNISDPEYAGKAGSKYIPGVRLLTANHKDITTFHVFGYGLPEEEWTAFSRAAIAFHPSPLPPGITNVHWNTLCKTGEPVRIQGICHNPSSAKYKMILTGFGATLDSTSISGDTSQAFTLTTIPEGRGRQLYNLSVITGTDTVEKEMITVQAEESHALKILMLASSPDFENKFLKTAIAKEGYEVTARTTISKNKYAYDYLNTADISLPTIGSSLLQKFDIVIADASELAHLPGSQLAAIQSSVSQNGKGLLIRADTLLPSSFYARFFPFTTTEDSAQQLKLFLTDTSQKLQLLTVDNPVSIRSNSSNQTLVQDAKNKAYASAALYGAGKIVVTTLPNTYAWALSGNEEAYHRFWSALLSKASATLVAGESWTVSPFLPRVNEPVQLCLQTDHFTPMPQGQVNGTPVYLKNNAGLPYQWSGVYWPMKKGWQISTTSDGKPFYWYAYTTADWQNVQASQKIISTQHYISSHLYREKEAGANRTEQTEFPKLYFFFLFLAGASFLWAESKGLFSSRI